MRIDAGELEEASHHGLRVAKGKTHTRVTRRAREPDGSRPILDVELERGQVLCVQAGYPHLVRATSAATSLHVTIGIYPVDTADFLEFVKAEVVREAWARTPLPWTDPRDIVGPARSAWAADACSEMAKWLSESEPDELLDRFLAFRAQSFAPPAALELLEALDDKKRLDSSCSVMLTDPRIPVHYRAETVTLLGRRLVVEPGARQDAVRDLLAARSRPTAPLSEIADRHGLTGETVVALARELVDLGALRVVAAEPR